MDVIGIISSFNRDGNTATIVREVLRGVEAEGLSAAEVYLPDYRIENCRGCLRCTSQGDCPIQDDFGALREKLIVARGLVLSAPAYGGAPCAMMKTFIDRLGIFEYTTSSVFGGKYAVSVSTAASFGAKGSADYLTRFLLGGSFKRGYVTGTLGVNLRGRRLPGDGVIMNEAYGLGRKLVSDIRNARAFPLQNLFKRLMIKHFMKPGLTRAILREKDGMMKAVYKNLVQRGLLFGPG